MPRAHQTRTIAASIAELWEVIGDPHHLPRWWPKVTRVEGVEEEAFTEVLLSPKGKIVRADFQIVEVVRGQRVVWSQQVLGTPFEQVLKSAETRVELTELDTASEVSIELVQELQGFRSTSRRSSWISGVSRLGSPLVRRAADATIEEALSGLEQIVGH